MTGVSKSSRPPSSGREPVRSEYPHTRLQFMLPYIVHVVLMSSAIKLSFAAYEHQHQSV